MELAETPQFVFLMGYWELNTEYMFKCPWTGHDFYKLKNPFLLGFIIKVMKNNLASHPQKQMKGLSDNLSI